MPIDTVHKPLYAGIVFGFLGVFIKLGEVVVFPVSKCHNSYQVLVV
jgi:hypothetical protein